VSLFPPPSFFFFFPFPPSFPSAAACLATTFGVMLFFPKKLGYVLSAVFPLLFPFLFLFFFFPLFWGGKGSRGRVSGSCQVKCADRFGLTVLFFSFPFFFPLLFPGRVSPKGTGPEADIRGTNAPRPGSFFSFFFLLPFSLFLLASPAALFLASWNYPLRPSFFL